MTRKLKLTLPEPPVRGSRQPILKLPRVMPGGVRTNLHPLLWLIRNGKGEPLNKSLLARALDVEPQSIYKWERQCKLDRNFPVPILRAGQIADYFDVSPTLLRPDVKWGRE